MTQTVVLKNKKLPLSQENPAPYTIQTTNTGGIVKLTYYGARYLDPKTSRWLSSDPALGEYIPLAPLGENERKHNSNLPGMGGVFNLVNLHVYHYAGNNPVKYVDPDGRENKGGFTKFILKMLIGEKNFNELFNDPIYDGFADISDTILHAAIEFPVMLIGHGADIVGMIAMGSGNVPLAATAAGVSKTADFVLLGSLLVKATNSNDENDWIAVAKQAAALGIKNLVSWSLKEGIAEVRITQSAKNGGFYQKKHIGRLTNAEGFRKLIMQDLAPQMGGKSAEILTNTIIDSLNNDLNKPE